MQLLILQRKSTLCWAMAERRLTVRAKMGTSFLFIFWRIVVWCFAAQPSPA
jgi:hypothetical protein